MLWSFAYFFCLLCGYYILRPVRDEMGIQGGVENLQWLFTGTFLTMLAAVPLFGWVSSRYPRRKFLPIVYLFFVANLLIFYVLIQFRIAPTFTAQAFFIWVSVFNLFVVSVFWSFMADLYRNEQARRLFGFISAGGSLGALAGTDGRSEHDRNHRPRKSSAPVRMLAVDGRTLHLSPGRPRCAQSW